MAKILLIEDTSSLRYSIKHVLELNHHEATEAENGREGLDLLEKSEFDLVITDILMPEVNGSEVIAKITSKHPRPRILAISGGGSNIPTDEALSIAHEKADGTLKKPFSKKQLEDEINRLLA